MPPLNGDSSRALLEILGVAVLPGNPAGLDFVVLGGSMAALLGERSSGAEALGEVAAGVRSPVTGKALVGRMGGIMSSTSSREGRSRVALIPRNPEIPPDMTPGGIITLAASASGARRGEARDRAAELMGWLGMAGMAETPCGVLAEEQRRLAFLGASLASVPSFLVVSCPVHECLLEPLTDFATHGPGRGVLFTASRLGEIPPGTEMIALCDESGIRASVRHSQLLEAVRGGAEIQVSFYPVLPRKVMEQIPGVRDLVHRDGYYFFNHSDTAYALVQVCNTARANARSIAYLSVAPPSPSALLASFLPPGEEPPQDLFGPARS
jgi:ABC-type Na+ transport system ATPase subunit NatA